MGAESEGRYLAAAPARGKTATASARPLPIPPREASRILQRRAGEQVAVHHRHLAERNAASVRLELALRHVHRPGGLRGEPARPRLHLGVERRVGDDAVQETALCRCRRVESIAQQDQLLREPLRLANGRRCGKETPRDCRPGMC